MMRLLAMFKEPSTMAGLSVLMGLFGVPNVPEILQGVASIATGAFGLAAVIMPERGGE